MTSVSWKTTSLVGALVLLASCQQEQAATVTSDNEAVTNAQSASTRPAGSPTLWNDGAQVPLDLQAAHANGVVLQLTSLQSRDTETVIGVRVINGANRAVDLNRFNNRDGYLVIDSGERLYLSPPASNPKLSVQPGQTLEGELVFLGRLPQTQNAVLVLNENSSTDSEHTRVPGFRINLPLSGPPPAEAAS